MIKKILLSILLLLVIVSVAGYFYISTQFPIANPAEDLTIKITPERFERGKYLVENVANCFTCHSTRDISKYSQPFDTKMKGGGGNTDYLKEKGMPGDLHPANITPHGIGDWTDGELLRAITEGIGKDGRALFPIMPYMNYGKMDKDDVLSMIAYIRSIKSVENDVPKTKISFPMNIITNFIPKPAEFSKRPPEIDKYNYGKYLATVASCNSCHTPMKKGQPLEGMSFAGGFKFIQSNGDTLYSANITPDKKTGIGEWSKSEFIQKFKQYDVPTKNLNNVGENEANTIMAWSEYAKMTEADLGAIYEYLSKQKAVENLVPAFAFKK